MATTCTNCGCSKPKCGCQDTMLTSPAPCPTPVGCLTPEPCSEVLDAQCIIYTGDDIICNTDTVVSSDDSVALALNSIVDYFCNAVDNIALKKKFVKETIFPDADHLETTILYSEYLPCLVNSEYCGTAIPSLTDIAVTGYWYDANTLYWTEFTHKDKSEIYIDNSGNVLVISSMPALATYPINVRIIITN